MIRISRNIVERAVNKALSSTCRYRVSAIGLNRRGEVVFSARNSPRYSRTGGGIHAEMQVMLKGGPSLHSIVICRVNRNGVLRRIDPCEKCRAKADELGARIYSVDDNGELR